MDKPKILNADIDTIPDNAVYIGRSSRYGNPYRLGIDGDVGDIAILYLKYLVANPELVADIRQNLKGKILVCHCSGELCHGSILMLLAG